LAPRQQDVKSGQQLSVCFVLSSGKLARNWIAVQGKIKTPSSSHVPSPKSPGCPRSPRSGRAGPPPRQGPAPRRDRAEGLPSAPWPCQRAAPNPPSGQVCPKRNEGLRAKIAPDCVISDSFLPSEDTRGRERRQSGSSSQFRPSIT